MSGFAGAVHRNAADEQAFAQMSEQIRAQGADSHESLVKRGLALSFSRLRISSEPYCCEQPLSLDGNIWIVADARLDSRESLMDDLLSEGEPVSPNSADAELILRSHRVWGQDSLGRLQGDFFFGDRE